MKRRHAASTICITAFALWAMCAQATAKSYQISNYDVEIDVRKDGDLRVVEMIRYEFTKGTFSYAYRKIPIRGFDDIEFVSLTSPDGPVTLTSATLVDRWTRSLKIRWKYPETGGSRAFRIEYIARGVLGSRGGLNILDWAAIGNEWEVPVRDVDVRVRLPWVFESGIDANHDATAGPSADGTVVRFHEDLVKKQDGFRITVKWPEKLAVPPREKTRYAAETLTIIASGVLVLILLLVVFWRQVGRVEPMGVPSAVATYPDSNLSVAEAAALVHHGSMARISITSLVFDLARRGILRIEARKKTGAFKSRSFDVEARVIDRSAGLPPWDERVVEELERQGDLKKFSRRTSVISKSVKDLKNHLREIGLVSKEREALRKKWLVGSLVFAGASVAFLVLVVLYVRKDLLAPAVLAFAAGWALALTSAMIEVRSRRGMTLACAFRAYGRWQKARVDSLVSADPSRAASQFAENLPELVLDKKVDRNWIKKLQKKMKSKPIEFRLPEWMVIRDATGNPLDATAAAIECFEAFTQSTAIVAVYAGGAASAAGGGAGGAGGGGGGAG